MVSRMNSPVRLGVSPAAASTPMGIFSQRFEALFPHAGTLGCLVYPPVHQPPCCHASSPPRLPISPPLLQVWVNVSSLSPWWSDFRAVRFSVSSGCFLFLNCCARRHSVSTYASILVFLPFPILFLTCPCLLYLPIMLLKSSPLPLPADNPP